MHWASHYIGLPWTAHGAGPDAFNCWSFVRMVQERHFGRSLPEIPNPEDLMEMARAFRDHPERRHWALTSDPSDGDCVLLRQARFPIHVGVWLAVDGGGVLHCSRDSGVVYQRPSALLINGWKFHGLYRPIAAGGLA
jgi:hypothetical protein